MMRKTRGVGVPRPLGKAAVPMRKLAGFLLAAVLLTLPVRALEPVVEPIATSGYTYYVIDAGGKLYAWGDSFHGAVGPADQDPLYWEDANILLENARYVAAGFVMAAAIDTDGALWGWGGHAGRTFGEEEPYRLLENVAEVSIGDTSCTALRTDGTVWIWGARSGESLKKHPDDPFFRPVQALDHVARLEGDMAVLEDGTLVQFGFDGDTLTARTLMKQVADVRTWSGFDSGAFILVQGLDGSLWRVPCVTVSEGDAAYEVFGQPEKFLEKVDWFTPSLAVTADGSLWAWGQFRPAMLREGQVDPSDPLLTASLPATEYDNGVVKIMEGVAAAVNCSDRTLVVLEDGSLWQIPAAYMLSDWQENRDRTPNRPEKILDQALAPGTPPEWPEEAPAPEVLPAASLEIWQAEQENAEAEPVPLEPQAEPSPKPAAPESSPAASLAAVITSAAALALVGWLRSRRH